MKYPDSVSPAGRACGLCKDPDPVYGYEPDFIADTFVCGSCYGRLLSKAILRGNDILTPQAADHVEYPKTLPSLPALPSQMAERVVEPPDIEAIPDAVSGDIVTHGAWWEFNLYLVTNLAKTPHEYYVGQTTQPIAERWKEHLYDARRGSPYPLYHAMRKYGVENFVIEPLVLLDEEFTDRASLNAGEIKMIRLLRVNCKLYNIHDGGENVPRKPRPTPQPRQALSRCDGEPDGRSRRRKYANRAEQQRAYRERKAAIQIA